MKIIEQYFAAVREMLDRVEQNSGPDIHRAAEAVADAVAQDKLLLLFGSGHSALVAREAAGRAGGLLPAMAIEDIAHGDAERLEGMAQIILSYYDLEPGSVIIVISNSGINPVPIEVAMLSKQAGLKVVAITALAHSQAVASRHSGGKRLYELADIVIDTHGLRGDAALTLPGSEQKTGGTSTLIGVAIVQAITAQAAALLIERGIDPPLIVSMNVPEGDAHNRRLMERYRSRLVRYQFSSLGP